MAGVKAPPKHVKVFQLTCWPMGHKVPTSTNSLVELMNMVEKWRQKHNGPVAVVSPDGRSRVGVYCAANACIEQVIQHGEVDIFQAVKTVRRHRPQLVENMVSQLRDVLFLIIFVVVSIKSSFIFLDLIISPFGTNFVFFKIRFWWSSIINTLSVLFSTLV